MRTLLTLLVPLCLAAVEPAPVGPAPAEDPIAQRGEQLYRVAACVGCHSLPDGWPKQGEPVHLAGGRDNPTMFGTFYAPNISPDPTVGIGSWTEEDFFRAMREGRSPEGRIYWPTFPYMAYTKLTDEDIHALWVYLRSQPAVTSVERAAEPKPFYRIPGLIRLWRGLEFRSGAYEPDPEQSETWNRGAYLVQAVTYCDQCHTPRGRSGLMQRRRYLAGGANMGKDEIHPNLTPHPTAGIGSWSEAQIASFLETGVKPSGETAYEPWIMAEKVVDSYRWLSEADRLAIATYLKSVPPNDFDPAAHDW